MKRIVGVNTLPGQPLDGSGRTVIHLFVPGDGPFVEKHALHMEEGKLVAKPTRGRLACNPKRTVAPITRNGVTTITQRTNDPRAVTCPKCIASDEYKDMMDLVTEK